jgi:hypothetical protein
MPWLLDVDGLRELADEWADRYRAAQPFPHVVLDDVVPEALLDGMVADFPAADDPGWKLEDMAKQRKQQWNDAARLPATIAAVVAQFNAAPFLTFLERLTGINGLIGDPHCHHGGPHQTLSGGFLKVHTDHPTQPALHLQRRVNVLIFLNRDWEPGCGGELELWDTAMTRCAERIEPRFNRLVVFDPVGSRHGHPDPAVTSPGFVRRSIALYYYVSPTHPSALSPTALTPGLLLARPGELIEGSPPPTSRWWRWRAIALDLLPPAAVRMIRRVRRR